MKFKSLIFSTLFVASAICFTSCSDKSEPSSPSTDEEYVFGIDAGNTSCNQLLFDKNGEKDFNGKYLGNGEQNFVFKGTTTLKKGTYVLTGWVYVADGSTLTIEPGTIIKGDKTTKAALIVEPGGKLIAKGTVDAPIVFTSNQAKGERKPGDWGGVIVCGKAKNNQNNDQQIEGGPRTHHGGTNDDDNSGILSYIRIEFAGAIFQTDKEINGLTLGSVGRGTQIDHIQVSYSSDDSFEWFGGCVNCKYLIAYKGWDDDFDTDNGYSGNVQYALGVRDPRIADISQSNGFESDNCADGSLISPYTNATFSNVTLIGPMTHDGFSNSSDYITGGEYNPNNGVSLGKFQAAFQIRRSSRLNIYNSLAIGYPIGLIIDGEKGNSVNAAKDGTLALDNVWMAKMGVIGSDANKKYEDVLYDAANKVVIDANQVSFSNSFFKSKAGNAVKELSELLLTDNKNIGFNYLPNVGSPLLTNGSTIDLLTKGFDNVSFIGAFGSNDRWLDGWTNFDPNATEY